MDGWVSAWLHCVNPRFAYFPNTHPTLHGNTLTSHLPPPQFLCPTLTHPTSAPSHLTPFKHPHLLPPQFLCAILHVSDLGHALKGPHLHARWTRRALSEFFAEAEMLKEIGSQPLPFMDPAKCFVPAAQMEYLDFVVRPFVVAMARIVPALAPLPRAVACNYTAWVELLRVEPGAPVSSRGSSKVREGAGYEVGWGGAFVLRMAHAGCSSVASSAPTPCSAHHMCRATPHNTLRWPLQKGVSLASPPLAPPARTETSDSSGLVGGDGESEGAEGSEAAMAVALMGLPRAPEVRAVGSGWVTVR